MKNFLFYSILVVLVGSSSMLGSCKKLKGMSKGNLEFSNDTVVFDTIFTTIGSTTKQFKIYNYDNKEITIDEVELVGGSASPFRLNLDGLTGTEFSNLKIEGGDSLYCFVEVTLSQNGQNLPLVVEDSIRFQTNGVDQYVKLAVWGQDMYYHYSNFGTGTLDTNEGTWPNDKPHVIYGAAIVDSAKTLDIPGGTQIYMHKNSILYNYKGTLNINGTLGNEVVIQGDRLEADYDNVAGQYYGVYYHQSRPSTIDYAIIKNSIAGIHVYGKDESFSGPNVTIKNTKISNAASYGLFLFDGPEVEAENTLVHSNGVHALIVLQGADFVFTHCDFLGYGAGDYTSPAVGIRNYYTDGNGTTTIGQINQGEFRNCVIYGYGEDQLAFDTLQPGGVNINIDFRNCLLKTTLNQSSTLFQSCLYNGNPAFSSIGDKNFDFTNVNSALNGAGSISFPGTLSSDIAGEPKDSPPDIGCYDGP
jgi:hypothetical protein